MKIPMIPRVGELAPSSKEGAPGALSAPPIDDSLRAGPKMLRERQSALDDDPEVTSLLSLEGDADAEDEFEWAIYGRSEED